MAPPIKQMPPPPLTQQEQKTLDQMKAVCARHGPKSTQVTQNCVLLRQQQILDDRLKQAERDSLARDQLIDQKRQADEYVSRTMHQLQNEGTLLLGAIMQASGQFDVILAARASKPVIYDVLGTLAIAMLPELKLLGKVVGRWVSVANSASRHSLPSFRNSKVQLPIKGWSRLSPTGARC